MTSDALSRRIGELESKIGAAFPEDYKQFLEAMDGTSYLRTDFEFIGVDGYANSSRVGCFFSVSEPGEKDLETNYHFYVDGHRIPGDILPIAEDIGGNLICLDLHRNRGKVYFWDHELELEKMGYDNMAPLADTFTSFLEILRK